MAMAVEMDAVFLTMQNAANLLPLVSRTLSQTIAPMLVTALWQSAIVAAGLTICLRVMPGISAAPRFLIWSAGFAAMVCLPFLPLLLRPSAVPVTEPGTRQGIVLSVLQLNIGWGLVILIFGAAASIFRAMDLGLHCLRLRKLWKTAVPVEFENVTALLSTSLLLRRRVELCTTQELENPAVIGFFAPRILIPAWLFERMTPGELEQIVRHETEHLRRGDDWSNLLQKLCVLVFPLNPALLWVERQMCLTREMACDESVVKATRAPRAYATCLTSLAERGRERRAEALSLGAWQRRSELTRRVHSILLHKDGLKPATAFVSLFLMGGGLLVGTAGLSRCPELVAFVPSVEQRTSAVAVKEQPQPARMIDATYTETISHPGVEGLFRAVEGAARMPVEHVENTDGSSGHRHWNLAERQILRAKSQRANFESTAALSSRRGTAVNKPAVLEQIAVSERLQSLSEDGKLVTGSKDSAAVGFSQTFRSVFLRAEVSGPESAPQIEQQWIVFTASESSHAVGHDPHASALRSDSGSEEQMDSRDDNKTEAQPTRQGTAQPARQGTVTHLILRVIPPDFPTDFPFHRPALAHVSSGWLVLQL